MRRESKRPHARVQPALLRGLLHWGRGLDDVPDSTVDSLGECLDNARFDTGLGEALQVTTGTRTDGGIGGILVWRKADNLTWFSDGVNTWINGPQGLQRRLNAIQTDLPASGRPGLCA